MRHRFLLVLWLLTDIAFFLAFYIIAYFLRVGFIFSTDFPFDHFLIATIFVTPFWLVALTVTRVFSLMRRQKHWRTGAYIAFSAILGTALFSLSYYFLFGVFFSRLLLIEAFFFTWIGIWIWHIFFEKILRNILHTRAAYPTLIVGVTRESEKLITLLHNERHPLTPVAILDARGAKEKDIAGIPVKGKLDALEKVLEEDHITHLIQCSNLEQSLNLLSACRQKGITYIVLPSVFGIIERDERVDRLEGQPVTVVNPKNPWWEWPFQ